MGKFIIKIVIDWENYFFCVLNEEVVFFCFKFVDEICEKNDDILKEDIV